MKFVFALKYNVKHHLEPSILNQKTQIQVQLHKYVQQLVLTRYFYEWFKVP